MDADGRRWTQMDTDEIKNLWPGYQVFKVFLLYSSSRQGPCLNHTGASVSRDPEVLLFILFILSSLDRIIPVQALRILMNWSGKRPVVHRFRQRFSINHFIQRILYNPLGTCFFEFWYEVAHDALIDDDFDCNPVFVK